MTDFRLLAILPLLAACGPREPGPLDTDRGQILFWRVAGSAAVEFKECSDNTDFRARPGLQPPKFEENSFLIYKVDDQGKTATAQDCTTTLASSCKDDDSGMVFNIDGHKLIFDPAAKVTDVTGSTCDLQSDEKWTLEDQGETLSMTVDIAFDLVGDATACAAVDQYEKDRAPNGKGFDGCVISLKINTSFDH